MAIYRPPFAPYCQRQESNDPNPALRTPWDGCWTWTLARALDGATGGAIASKLGIDNKGGPEDVIRKAAGNLDDPGSDGGTTAQQVKAVQALAPGLWFKAYPTPAELVACLARGGFAVLAGWENNAPTSDRAYDQAFYDRIGANGHSNLAQGVGDGKSIYWGNPEKPVSAIEPVVPIGAATKFAWAHTASTLEAIIFNPFELAAPLPAFNEVNMKLAAGIKSSQQVTTLAQTNLRAAPSITAAVKANTGSGTPTLPLVGAPIATNDVRAGSFWYPVAYQGELVYVHSTVSTLAATPAPVDSTPFDQNYVNTQVSAATKPLEERIAAAKAALG